MTKRTTKRALLLSCLSLLLCVSMLVGTTFAWFTDSASTGVNTIQSGNLDIALYAGDQTVVDGKVTAVTYSKEVDKDTKLFNDDARWEPGYTEVAYLKIENKGSLSLKYQLSVNVVGEVVGKNVVDGGDIKLSEILKYDLVEITEAQYFADRAEALEAVTNEQNLASETVSGEMAPAATKYLALIVYMPTTVGNAANHDGKNVPSIQMGVTLAATQLNAELDGFGSDYDKTASLPVIVISGENTVADAGKAKVDIPADALPEGTVVTFNATEGSEIPEGIVVKDTDEAVVYELTLVDKDGNPVTFENGAKATVTVNVGKGRIADNIKVYHHAEAITGFKYDAETGILTFETASFSPFTVVEGNILKIGTAEELRAFSKAVNEPSSKYMYKGWTVKLTADIDLAGENWTPINGWDGVLNNTVIDGQGHSIKNMTVDGGDSAGFISNNASSLTIKNVTFSNAYVKTTDGNTKYAGVIMGKNYSSVTLEAVKVVDSQVRCTWQCGGLVGFAEGNAPKFVSCSIENSFVGGYNSTAGAFFGLGAVSINAEKCTVKNVDLYTDGLTWNSTQKNGGDTLIVGHLYGNALNITECTVEDVAVVSDYPAN